MYRPFGQIIVQITLRPAALTESEQFLYLALSPRRCTLFT
jgi:hypothetical protein